MGEIDQWIWGFRGQGTLCSDLFALEGSVEAVVMAFGHQGETPSGAELSMPKLIENPSLSKQHSTSKQNF